MWHVDGQATSKCDSPPTYPTVHAPRHTLTFYLHYGGLHATAALPDPDYHTLWVVPYISR